MSYEILTKDREGINRSAIYVENLKRLLSVYDFNFKILKKNFGILKGVIKKTPLALQKEMRKEWERKI